VVKSSTLFLERKENLAVEEDQEQLVFPESLDLMDPVDLLVELDLQDHLESQANVVKEVKWVLHSKDNQEKRVIKVHLEQLEVEQERSALTLERKIFTLDQKEIEAIRDEKVRLEKRALLVLLD
jgi:ABC-type phosphate transport system auxiliary subunit